MAKRKSNPKHTSKIEPSVQTLAFGLTIPVGISNFTIDLSQTASIMNRRFYRQGLNWAVSGFKIRTVGPGIGTVAINKLPNTWVMSNAWEKGFRHWNRQQKEALEESSEGVRARFSDFKIYADDIHLAAGVGNNLLPFDSAGNSALPGEWQMSQIVVPNHLGVAGTNIEPLITAVGDANLLTDPTKFSLIEAYANSRSVPQSPDPKVPTGVTSGPENIYRQMFDVGADDDMVMDNAVAKNNDLPYPQSDYPGGGTQLSALLPHDATDLSATTISGSSYLKGGNFPCGLIRIAAQSAEGFSAVLLVDLIPGNHRGYMCEPMTEM